MLPRKVCPFVCHLSSDFLSRFVGTVRVRMTDFHSFLCGTDGKPGLLRRLDLPYDKVDYSEERLRQYTHFLGFGYDLTGAGAFTDAHESKENRKDRHERFLPEYFAAFNRGISEFLFKGSKLGVDTRLEDDEGNDLTEQRATLVEVEDLDGNTFTIDMGGIIPEGDDKVPLLVSHDEACFGAGEFESRVRSSFSSHLTSLSGRLGKKRTREKEFAKTRPPGPSGTCQDLSLNSEMV